MEKPKKGPRRPRSVAWIYFEKVPNEDKKARCNLCGVTCTHANNTSNLFNHLRFKHPTTFSDAIAQRDEEKKMYYEMKAENTTSDRLSQMRTPGRRGRKPKWMKERDRENGPTAGEEMKPVISATPNRSLSAGGSFFSTYSSFSKKTSDKEVTNRALMKMLAVELMPCSVVKRSGFRDFVRSLDARYELPAKKSLVKTMLPQLAEETKNAIKREVSAAPHLTLTVDLWSYCAMQNFITVTAHFIKDTWKMSSVVLDSFDCTEDNTASDIATGLKCITDEWGITDRINAFVSDSKDNNIITATVSTGWEHLPCFGNILNTVVLNALMSVAEIARIKKKTSEAVAYFEKNTKATESLMSVQSQHNLPLHKLKQEVATRWNSTYYMLERMVEQYEAVNTILCFHSKDHMCMCDDEVETIRCVIQVLCPFEAATKELCTDQYTCMSKVIPIATLLQQVTASGNTSLSEAQSALKNALLQQMDQHFANLEVNHSLAVATLLDPRFKKHAFTDSTALENAEQHLMSELLSNFSSSDSVGDSSLNPDSNSASFWVMFDQRVCEAGAKKTASSEADNESRRYFKEANIDRCSDPLVWWKLNEVQYPHLKILAQKYLCIPATAIPSQRLFTKRAEEDAYKRDHLKPSSLLSTVFLNKNL